MLALFEAIASSCKYLESGPTGAMHTGICVIPSLYGFPSELGVQYLIMPG